MKSLDLFLIFLKLGLWLDNKDIIDSILSKLTTSPDEETWKESFRLAINHASVVQYADGVNLLPSTLRPSSGFIDNMLFNVYKVWDKNNKIDIVIDKVIDAFHKHDIPFSYLKGKSLCDIYPNRQSRAIGDIDLYTGKETDRAYEVLVREKIALPDGISTNIHISLCSDDVEIELHRITSTTRMPFTNSFFQRWTKASIFGTEQNINGRMVKIAEPTYYCTYLFIHLFQHFVTRGIGLRHCCDIVRFLYVKQNNIDKQELIKNLKCLKLYRAWQVFGCVFVDILGLPELYFPGYKPCYKEKAKIVFCFIIEDGDTGNYSKKLNNRPRNELARSFRTFRLSLERNLQLLPIFPYNMLLETLNLFIDNNYSKHFTKKTI